MHNLKKIVKVKLSQKFSLKYLIYAILLNSLILLPYTYIDAINNSMIELVFAILFITLILSISVAFYSSKNEKLWSSIFVLTLTILWILFFIFLDKNSIAVIFFIIYPLLTMILLTHNKSLLINLFMLVIFWVLFSIDLNSKTLSLLNPIALRVSSVYLMILGTSYFWKKNNHNIFEKMNSIALFDSLTGASNKKSYELYMDNFVIERNKSKQPFSILFIDIDNFKKINDSPGHEVGNKVLIEVTKRINACLDTSCILFKIGGDEFIVLIPQMIEDYYPALISNKILSYRDDGFYLPTLSIGIANFPEDGSSGGELVKKAENAMFKAKNNGKNTFSFFHKEFNKLVEKRMIIEKELQTAIENNELSLVFQPKIASLGKGLSGAEALVRWENKLLGQIPPSEFISIAEDSDLIHSISTWIYRESFKMLARAQKMGFNDLILSVNVSPVQISKNTLINSLNIALEDTGICPSHVELEITEGMLLKTDNNNQKTLSLLRQQGFRIAIDDFGTGYSSLRYLQKLNLDSIKIDQSFIKNIEEKNAYNIIRAIISLAKSLELQTVAEGVETNLQMNILDELGCDLIQGYYFSRPLCETTFLKLLKKMNV